MNAQLDSPATTFGHRLNTEQLRAATFGRVTSQGIESDPLLIIAGAGTGKTNTLAHRVAHLLLHRVSPERILLLTFTRRAAQEMLRRAETIANESLRQQPGRAAFHPNATRLLWSGTFHAIGNRLLREYAPTLGLDPTFSVIDRGDAADLIDYLRQDLGLARKEKRFPRKDTCIAIYSHRVNTRQPLQQTLDDAFPWCAEWSDELTCLFRRYVETKQAQQLLDYDDLLLYWHVLVQEPQLARDVGARFDHVLVDEYQDTNTLQSEILLAMKPAGTGVCVVGDDAQAIYSFRAATVENILQFPQRFAPPAQIVTLEQNYRSVQPVLDAANALMRDADRQYQKQLHSPRASQHKPRYVSVEDDHAQALYVVEQILAAREQGTALRKQAVLMRNSHHSDVLELELIRRNIPYAKYGGLKFLEAAHVKDVLAVLRWIDNPRNRLAGFRVLQLLAGFGPAHADRCLKVFEASGHALDTLTSYQVPTAAAEDWPALMSLLRDLSGSSDWAGQMQRVRQWYEPHLQRLYDAAAVRSGDIDQLEKIALQYESRERFITELTLDPPQVSSDLSAAPHLDEDYLILSTVHSAKGQEWDSVYVLNVADGNFPNEHATGKRETIEEERRLLYVAMTRAKHDLQLIAPLRYYITQQSRTGDRHVYGARSRFLTDELLKLFEARTWPQQPLGVREAARADSGARIDAGGRLRAMWD
ncbi:MAG TPA: ATP-dependent helicase [Povalibacter sp.]|uniref:ATP-dependent helicase n=1 Tax=Povalibacter sp. TaxID=1962978 RepID=UPI002BAD315A|nr:ATP-dependent helicase [Povalibacter sp.]HMN46306.1 ATP-dependent helicase [Povalibacter sp.]